MRSLLWRTFVASDPFPLAQHRRLSIGGKRTLVILMLVLTPMMCVASCAQARFVPPGWHRSFDGFVYPSATRQWRVLDRVRIRDGM